MKRRSFIQAIASLAAVIVNPFSDRFFEPGWLVRFRRTGRLVNENIVLTKPLLINEDFGACYIEGCTFRKAKGFEGNSLLQFDGYQGPADVIDCQFDGIGSQMIGVIVN